MPDCVPLTGPVNLVENGRKLAFVSNHSLAESGKYRLGRLQAQRLSVRMPRVDKAPQIVRAKRTAAATSAATKVLPSTPPTSPAHQLLQLPYLPSSLEYHDRRCSVIVMHQCTKLLSFASIARSLGRTFPGYLLIYVYLFESTLKAEKHTRNS